MSGIVAAEYDPAKPCDNMADDLPYEEKVENYVSSKPCQKYWNNYPYYCEVFCGFIEIPWDVCKDNCYETFGTYCKRVGNCETGVIAPDVDKPDVIEDEPYVEIDLCENGIQDNGEKGRDCGGECVPCEEGFECGNNLCEVLDGENCKTCVKDCSCNLGGECNPSNDYSDSMGCVTPDLCDNDKKDNGEEGIDCGGNCDPCDFKIFITPKNVELFTNGRDKQKFTVSVVDKNGPVAGVSIDIMVRELSNVLWLGVEESSVITGPNGKATYIYEPTKTGSRYKFGSTELDITANYNRKKDRAHITLNDPVPRINVDINPRVVKQGEGTGTSNIAITLEDLDSESWSYIVESDIGFIQVGGKSKSVSQLVESSDSKLNANWVSPDSLAELMDYVLTHTRSKHQDWVGLKNNVNDQNKALALSLLSDEDAGAKVASELFDLKRNVKSLESSYQQIETEFKHMAEKSTSPYERYLNTFSIAIEGLQVIYGAKGYVESKVDQIRGKDSSNLNGYAEGMRDNILNYYIDRVQSLIRALAAVEHDANLNSMSTTAHIDITVVDEDGFKNHKRLLIPYIYYYNSEKDHSQIGYQGE